MARQLRRIGRRKLWLIGERICAYCDRELRFVEMTADHVIPLSRGGRDEIGNVVTACAPCNREKGNMTGDEFAVYRDIVSRDDVDAARRIIAASQEHQ